MVTQSLHVTNKNRAARITAFIYGVVCYTIFFITFGSPGIMVIRFINRSRETP